MTRLEFTTTPVSLWLSVLVGAATVVLAAVAWQRSGFARSIGLLELTRVLLVAGVLLVLAQPEWVEEEVTEERPEVVLIWDDSGSMQTRDVLEPGSATGAVHTRADWLEEQFDLGAWEAALGERFDVSAMPLSAAAGEAELAEPGSDLAGPLRAALDRPNLRAAVLLSDGDWNVGGSPHEVAMAYRLADVPLFTHTVGSLVQLPDLILEPLEPPTFAIAGKPVEIPFSIQSSMPRDVTATVILRDEIGLVATRDVVVPAKSTLDDRISWTPDRPGEVSLTLQVPLQSGELDEENNQQQVAIDVREESLKVLLIEGVARWEYRYLRNALVRDEGVEVDCLLLHPDLGGVGGGPHYIKSFPGPEQLSSYDVVFLGDVNLRIGQFESEHCRMIKGLVQEQASGLILMPGLRGGHLELIETDLKPLYPVELDPGAPYGLGSATPASLVLTESGRQSSLTRLTASEEDNSRLWETLPGFQWCAPVMRATAGSRVLAVHETRENEFGRLPLLATRPYGTGKVLFMGTDGAWRWREGYEDQYHYRFWGQVIRWMAYQRVMNDGESIRFYYSPDRPRVRRTIALNANVMDEGGAPLSGAYLTARVTAPSGRVAQLTFEADEGEWGLYRSQFRPTEPGEHAIELACRETGARLEATFSVTGRAREQLGLPARADVMSELAQVSRGAVLPDASPDGFQGRIASLPEPPPNFLRTRLWSHPALGATLVVLMAAFWIGRKAVGRI